MQPVTTNLAASNNTYLLSHSSVGQKFTCDVAGFSAQVLKKLKSRHCHLHSHVLIFWAHSHCWLNLVPCGVELFVLGPLSPGSISQGPRSAITFGCLPRGPFHLQTSDETLPHIKCPSPFEPVSPWRFQSLLQAHGIRSDSLRIISLS